LDRRPDITDAKSYAEAVSVAADVYTLRRLLED
jgi:hypothetical protein